MFSLNRGWLSLTIALHGIVRHVQGICDHLAEMVKKMHGLDINPLTDIAICCGQTEAFAAAVFAS